MFDSTSSTGGEQRGEEEKVSGRDDSDVVFRSINLFKQRGRTPTGAEDDKFFFRGVGIGLVGGVTGSVDGVRGDGSTYDKRAVSQTPERLPKGKALLFLWFCSTSSDAGLVANHWCS